MSNILQSKLQLFKSCAFGIAALVVGACGGGNVANTPPADTGAQQRLNAGQYRAAAADFLRVASTSEATDAPVYRASAANAFMLAGNFGAARKILAALPKQPSAPNNTARLLTLKQLAQARLAAQDQQFDAALAQLPPFGQVPVNLRQLHAETRVLGYSVNGSAFELAQAHADLDPYLRDATATTNNRQALWSALRRVPNHELEAAKQPGPDQFTGWIELAELSRLYVGDATGLNGALQVWRARFPSHPGSSDIASAIVEQTEQLGRPARHVAVILPLSGRFARAGAAVRDGFMGAWLNAGLGPDVRLTVLDSVNQDIVSLYSQAVTGGADFVVGPLRKENVAAIAASGAVSVPTLALNVFVSDSLDVPTLYQLALSPEQEALQVSERIWYDGHRSAVAIAPDSAWGQRVATAFAESFSALGGRVLETQLFESDSRDLSEPVKRLLNIDLSEQRVRSLRKSVAAELKGEVRRRQDVEAIFMAGFAAQARLLRPQLRFHRASTVPVYSTSHVYSGVPNADGDSDIDGVVFGDMPWIIDGTLDGDPLKRALSEYWAQDMAGFARLFAFGADAQALVSRVQRLRAQPGSEYQGYTGRLTVDTNNAVRRNLTWAQFREGIARNVDNPLSPNTSASAQ